MCPHRVELPYMEESARYDDKTRKLLEDFLNNKCLFKHPKTFNPPEKLYKNICWLNDTRRRVTESCCNRFVEDKSSYEINFKYKSRIEKYKVCIGMPVIATENMKNYDVYNMMEYTIDNIDKNNKRQLPFHINNETFNYDEFRKNFLSNFCNTVYKFQGGKIDENSNIHHVNKMDIKELYTALSRTTKLQYIHLNSRYLCNQYSEQKRDIFIIKNSYFNTDFLKGKIYEITFQFNDKYYVGSTTKPLQERRLNHINDPKSAIYKYRNDMRTIKLICECPCKDKKTLEKIENSYINEYRQKYGELLSNTKGVKIVKKKKTVFKVEMENQNSLRKD